MEFMNSNVNKIVIFEEVNSGFIPILHKYLKAGFIVYFYYIEDGLEKQKELRKYLEINQVVNLSKMIFDHLLYLHASLYAHKNLNNIFAKYFSNSPSIKITKTLLKSSEIENMYKKELLSNLHNL